MLQEQDQASFGHKLNASMRFLAVIVAGIPTTVLIPLPLTQFFTKRFEREEGLKKIHFMVQWARFCVRKICRMKLDIQGQEHLPSSSRGHLYISNHQSYVDILVLIDVLKTIAFLSKGLVRHFPVLGRSAYCGGTVFLERGNPKDRQRALEESLEMCHKSTAVVIFPEGTRSVDGKLREKIYLRAIQEAWRRGLKVVPIGLDGTYKVFPKSMDRLITDQPVAIQIGHALDPADFDSKEAFASECWNNVRSLFQKAQKQRSSLN